MRRERGGQGEVKSCASSGGNFEENPTPGLSATRKLNSCGSVLACDSVLRHFSWKSWPNKKPNIEDTGGECECREVARGGGKWRRIR